VPFQQCRFVGEDLIFAARLLVEIMDNNNFHKSAGRPGGVRPNSSNYSVPTAKSSCGRTMAQGRVLTSGNFRIDFKGAPTL
jgi:hypothetical protein